MVYKVFFFLSFSFSSSSSSYFLFPPPLQYRVPASLADLEIRDLLGFCISSPRVKSLHH